MDIRTISSLSKVEEAGLVCWTVMDQNGVTSVIETATYYIPSASIRLYSPQYHFRDHCDGSLRMDNVGLHLTLPAHRAKSALSFPFNAINNLPMMLPSHHPHFTSAMFSSSAPSLQRPCSDFAPFAWSQSGRANGKLQRLGSSARTSLREGSFEAQGKPMVTHPGPPVRSAAPF